MIITVLRHHQFNLSQVRSSVGFTIYVHLIVLTVVSAPSCNLLDALLALQSLSHRLNGYRKKRNTDPVAEWFRSFVSKLLEDEDRIQQLSYIADLMCLHKIAESRSEWGEIQASLSLAIANIRTKVSIVVFD